MCMYVKNALSISRTRKMKGEIYTSSIFGKAPSSAFRHVRPNDRPRVYIACVHVIYT